MVEWFQTSLNWNLHERPATAPGMSEAKQRSVNDAIWSKLELNVAGKSNEKNYAQKMIA